jgi:hypothetical protein
MSDIDDLNDDEVTEAMQDAAVRAQSFARKAIIRFLASEARDHPNGRGAVTAIAAQIGFMMSVIEMGAIAYRVAKLDYSKDRFLDLVGALFDDLTSEDEDESA